MHVKKSCFQFFIINFALIKFILDEFFDTANEYVFAHHIHSRTAMTIDEISQLASDDAEDLFKHPMAVQRVAQDSGNQTKRHVVAAHSESFWGASSRWAHGGQVP